MNPTDSSPAAPATSSRETSRRRLLTLLGAGGAAGLATLLSRDEARAGHDGSNLMHLGVPNSNPASPTSLNAPSPDNQVLNVSGRTSFQASSPQGVHGPVFTFRNNSSAAFGSVIQAATESEGAAGVMGLSMSTSPDGLSLESIGVLGRSLHGLGVAGGSDDGTGVAGNSPSGVGVAGSTLQESDDLPGTGVGVKASATSLGGGPSDGVALQVQGRAAFTSVGSGVIPAGQDSSGRIEDAHVRDDCHISVTLASDPGERGIRWVERQAGGFKVHLTSAPRKHRPETAFTYVILEPAAFDCC